MSRWDYVIVGAGSAGCVLADRLSADGTAQVLLIEAGTGTPETRPEVQVPILFPRLFGGDLDWNFATVPQRGLADRAIPIPRGKAVGGSSVINAQLWTRGHRADYDAWAETGLDGWSHDDLQPYFERAEQRISLTGLRHPLPVTPAFVNACAHLGYAPAAEVQEGYALARATHRDGLRHSSADAYLAPARKRPNLTVRADTFVRRVVFEGTRAVGIEVEGDSGTETIRAEREVILAAGSVGSPHLLLLSGVGPAGELSRHGVPLVQDVPSVGRDLTDHLLVPLAFEAEGFWSPGANASSEQIAQYLRDRHGAMDSIISEALLFLRTRDELEAPDIEVVHLVVPLGEHQRPAAHGLALGVILLRPRSRGTITLRSADPHDAPLIDPGYLSDEAGDDLATLVAGVRSAQQVLRQPEFAQWMGKPLTDGALSEEIDDITAYIRTTGGSIHHLVSTCRMGADEHSVVDPNFAVRGLTGLRVVDASTMPSIVRAHTHAPVTMLAERAADVFLQQR
ncbi:GMC family oxidoreductase [Streptomyces doebereineriae]|uniref:GMC family oxidoreductase N-terminal domain-containing protein n=1 Tax=Streptomyces doebereineriae TaxID=3075528 RepID=A0ABU2VHJ8_9ACTN|nr:GMC family oxidoreductase N-terminal domain-containing protein [Streptomyces sp. DSM 41640]MDT0484659.1 GMC family oxidoreductase N-terminal domain-containing protein [Streptomyces sp. DSM 41640]